MSERLSRCTFEYGVHDGEMKQSWPMYVRYAIWTDKPCTNGFIKGYMELSTRQRGSLLNKWNSNATFENVPQGQRDAIRADFISRGCREYGEWIESSKGGFKKLNIGSTNNLANNNSVAATTNNNTTINNTTINTNNNTTIHNNNTTINNNNTTINNNVTLAKIGTEEIIPAFFGISNDQMMNCFKEPIDFMIQSLPTTLWLSKDMPHQHILSCSDAGDLFVTDSTDSSGRRPIGPQELISVLADKMMNLVNYALSNNMIGWWYKQALPILCAVMKAGIEKRHLEADTPMRHFMSEHVGEPCDRFDPIEMHEELTDMLIILLRKTKNRGAMLSFEEILERIS